MRDIFQYCILCTLFFSIFQSLAHANTYLVDTLIDGAAFSDIDDSDFSFTETIFVDGVYLNTLSAGSPTATYTFILPPSSAGTYDDLTVYIRGNGGLIALPHTYLDGQEVTIVTSKATGTYSASFDPDTYITQEGNHGELKLSIKAAFANRYEIDYVRIAFAMTTSLFRVDLG